MNYKYTQNGVDLFRFYRDESVKLQDDEIGKLKAVLIKQRAIKEGTNQKDLLRQLTLLSS